MTISPFLELAGSQVTPTNMVTPFYKLLPNPTQPLPTSTNILSGLADARTNGVADDRSWSEKFAQFMTTPGILWDLVKEDSTTPSNPPSLIAAPPKTPKETVAEKAAKTDQQIAAQKQANTPKGNNDQTANVNAASQASTIMDVAKGFIGQSKPGDIPQQQQAETPTASAETPTGLAGFFADPRVQMALLGFGSGLANNMSGGQAVSQGAGQFFQEGARQSASKAAAEEKQYQRSQDELKNKREDRKVLNDEEKTRIDQQRADSLAKLQKAQADAEASGIEVDKARIRALNAATSKVYKEMKDGKTGKEAVSAKDYAKMLTDLSYNLGDPIEARRQLNDALPEDARRYATLTEEARTNISSKIAPAVASINELEAKGKISAKEDAELKAAKTSVADTLDYYGLIYGNANLGL